MKCDVCERLRDVAQRMEQDAGPEPPRAPEAAAPASAEPAPYAVGARVRHTVLGAGTVRAYDGDPREKIMIDFDDAGERQLVVAHVQGHGLLCPAS